MSQSILFIKNQSPSFLLHINQCCYLALPAQKFNVLFCLVHEIFHLKSSTWLPVMPGGVGTALPNYHLQNKPIQFSAKTNYVTNNNLAILWHLLFSEDFYLKHVSSHSKQSREMGSEGVTVCVGPRGHEGPQRQSSFLGMTSASDRLDPKPGPQTFSRKSTLRNPLHTGSPQHRFSSMGTGLTCGKGKGQGILSELGLYSNTRSVVY